MLCGSVAGEENETAPLQITVPQLNPWVKLLPNSSLRGPSAGRGALVSAGGAMLSCGV